MFYRILILLMITVYGVIAAADPEREIEGGAPDVRLQLADPAALIPGVEAAEDDTLIRGETDHFTFSSLTPAATEAVEALIAESNTNPLNPHIAEPERLVGNHLARITAGNFYHLVAFFEAESAVAVMVQGQMPKVGYKPPEHDRVIIKFAELLPAAEEAARPFGFSTMVPLFGEGVKEDERAEIYTAMMKLNKDLAQQGKTLPQASAGLIPYQLLILLDPDHPDVRLLTDLGFTNQGDYPEFYPPKVRTLLSYPLA